MNMNYTPDNVTDEMLQALADLSPMDYEQQRERFAEKHRIRVSVLDKEVEKRRPRAAPEEKD